MLKRDTIKSIALAGMIVFGLATQSPKAHAADLETLTVAGGCFWCVEADFEKVRGVGDVISGFTGGNVKNPTYKQVTAGGSGHYEAVQISYDPGVISQRALLDLFLRSVDPTDAGGQFCDRGESYRTAIFVDTAADESDAKAAIAKAQSDLGQTIVTPVLRASEFYPADAYHQDYYKGSKLILTRFGPKRQAAAYKAYRSACGRDARVRELWGNAAPFVGG